jgi:hypothetical protein
VIFSSDNGGPHPGKVTSNGPLRAGKGTLYEGGIRVCASARWPLTQAGTSLEQLVPVILGLDGVEVVDTRAGYLHATATSRLFGFVDDLEIHTLPASHELEVRSASRLGDSDLGVNTRRLERLHRALQDAHVVAATPE